MKPPRFEYLRADSTASAIAALREAGEDGRVLAGGQSLLPLMNFRLARPSHLVDITRVAELDYVTDTNGSIAIGAATRQAAAERSDGVARRCPLLVEALELVAHPPIRHRGTVCGSLAHADPASELVAVALALDGELVAAGPSGDRSLPAADFFLGPYATALGPGELLREVRLPALAQHAGTAIVEFNRTHGNFALAGAAAMLELGDAGEVTRAALCLFGASSMPVRAHEAERRLVGEIPVDSVIAAAADVALDGVTCISSMHGSADYRRRLGRVYAERALVSAVKRARGAGRE